MEAHVGPVKGLMEALASLPGIGKRSAERMVYHLVRAKADAEALEGALRSMRERVRNCRLCGNLTEEDICPICAGPRRDKQTICVVEMPQDLARMESTGAYKGLYHVLMGTLSPLEGVGPKDIRLKELFRRLAEGGAEELILATNPTAEGDATAAYIEGRLKEMRGGKPRVSRLARGIPAGSRIEYVDSGILGEAIRGRRQVPDQGGGARRKGL